MASLEKRRNRGLEEKGGETGDQVERLEEADENDTCERVTLDNSSTEESRNGDETAERSSSEDRDTVI